MNRRVVVWGTVVLLAIVATIVAVIVTVLLKRGAVANHATQAPPGGKVRQGRPAPEFQALTTHGLFDLDKVRTPVFLEVFATWCPHCQRETAVVDRLYRRYKDRVAFVGVSGSDAGMDGRSQSSQEDVMRYAQRFNVQYLVAYDGSLAIANSYLLSGFPTLVVIDHDKSVAYVNSGEIPYAELDAAVQKVLR